MNSYIDIHTHNLESDNPFSIINLDFCSAAQTLSSSVHQFFSVGIHPWDIIKTQVEDIDLLEKLLIDKRIKAIGECGLDKNSKSSIKEQAYFFERQVQLSEKYELPLIIHCVAAYNELIAMRKKWQPTQNWIIHGFRSKPQLASQLLNNGFILSFGEKFNIESLELTPIDKLCIETDESAVSVEEIFKRISTVKNCLVTELNAACQLLKLYVC